MPIRSLASIDINGLAQVPKVAKKVISLAKDKSIILLYGELGAGKTTLTQHLVNLMGYSDNISSPTYSIINEYKLTNDAIIFHMDLYRLKDLDEAIEIGIEDYLYGEHLCIIEWPDLILPLIEEENFLLVKIQALENGVRSVEILENV